MQLQQLQFHRYVLLTLSYSQVFSKPLLQEEIKERLIKLKKIDIVTILRALSQQKLIVKYGEYWQINHARQDLSGLRKKRERLSVLKLKELEPFVQFARSILWIRGLAVTGSVSVLNADAKDDVDLMIVVQPRRLWLVRPLLVLFSFMKGKRRSWNHEESNSWCLNLWLEEGALSVQPDKRSIYTAYEVCQARWLLSRNNAEFKFLKENRWVEKFLPTYFGSKMAIIGAEDRQERIGWLDGVLSSVNSAAYSLQRWYMQRHMTTERVGLSYAFFHPRNTQGDIFDRWKKMILSLD